MQPSAATDWPWLAGTLDTHMRLYLGFLALESQKLKATNPREVFAICLMSHPENRTQILAYLVTFFYWLITAPCALQCGVR